MKISIGFKSRTVIDGFSLLCYGQYYTRVKVVEAKVGLRQQYNKLVLLAELQTGNGADQ